MGAWTPDSKTHVAHMSDGDFYGSEKSVTVIDARGSVRIEFVGRRRHGHRAERKDAAPGRRDHRHLGDAASRRCARSSQSRSKRAKQQGVLLSLHLKATMMKVSDPVMFGHAVSGLLQRRLREARRHVQASSASTRTTASATCSPRFRRCPPTRRPRSRPTSRPSTRSARGSRWSTRDKGITNLHVPNDIIVDASMPVVIRDVGQDVGPGRQAARHQGDDPGSLLRRVYQRSSRTARSNGAFDPATMGSVPNVGLMAQAAEEYGSHDKTFYAPAAGDRCAWSTTPGQDAPRADGEAGRHLPHVPDQGRADPRLGEARRARAPAPTRRRPCSGSIRHRAHDAQVITKVERYLKDHDTSGLDISHHGAGRGDAGLARAHPQGRQRHDLGDRQRAARLPHRPVPDPRARHQRQDAVDRAAAGGRRPVRDGRRRLGAEARAAVRRRRATCAGIRWASSWRWRRRSSICAASPRTKRAAVLADTLDQAIGKFLDNNKSPARKVGQIDNRGSHFYLAMYWAEALANQDKDAELKPRFAKLPSRPQRQRGEDHRRAHRRAGQARRHRRLLPPGPAPRPTKAMRPSATLNAALAAI